MFAPKRTRRVIDDVDNVAIQRVYDELNFPSAANLMRALKARNIPFKAKEIERIVRDDPVRAVQATGYKFNGKIAANDVNDRWFADLIDFTAVPTDGGKKIKVLDDTTGNKKYILVVQDVFSRKIWAEAIVDKRPNTVAEAFKRIVTKNKKPRSLTTDAGAEFQHQFEEEVSRLGIEVRHKDPIDTNGIATLDVAIGNLKKALARVMRKTGNDDWSTVLQRVVDGQNALPNKDYLEGQAPKDVEGNSDLREHLKEKNRQFTAINQTNAEKRRRSIDDAGGFRAPVAPTGPAPRGWKPRFSDDVHVVKELQPRTVTDTNDREYDTRFVKPTATTNTRAPKPSAIERSGSVPAQNAKKAALQGFAEQLAEAMGNEPVPIRSLHTKLTDKAGFLDAASRVRLNKTGLYRNFVNLFPELFAVEGTTVTRVPPRRQLRPAAEVPQVRVIPVAPPSRLGSRARARRIVD